MCHTEHADKTYERELEHPGSRGSLGNVAKEAIYAMPTSDESNIEHNEASWEEWNENSK